MTAMLSDDLLVWWVLGIAIAVSVGAIILGRILDRPVNEKDLARVTGAHHFWLAVTFSNLSIRTKILIVLVVLAASSVGAFGIVEYREAKEALRTESFNKLTAVRELKAQQVEDYFRAISDQVVTFSESRTVTEAMRAFRETFKALEAKVMADHGAEKAADPELIAYYRDEFFTSLKPNTLDELKGVEADSFIPKAPQARHLQELYLAENPKPLGEKHRLDDAGDGSAYSAAHRVYHPIIRRFLEKFGYYDIFLIDPETGEIVYSVFKEVDYGTSLLTGPYKDTNFARVFRAARDAATGDFVRLEDFEPYYPSYNAPASFIGSPIFDGDEKIGVLVFQMPIERINDIMTSNRAWKDVGLGESGETYIVGGDFRMRNQSRFLIEDRENYLGMIRSIGVPDDTVRRIESFNSSIGLQRVETRGSREALSGRVNTEIFPDYRGVPVLSSYRPLRVPDVRWAIMSEIDEAEAFAPVEALKTRMLLLMGLFLAAILGISYVFAKTMTRPIKALTAKAQRMAKGDLGVIVDTAGGDEISHLARSLDVMREALRELIESLEEKVRERTAELEKNRSNLRLALDQLESINSVILRWNPDGLVVGLNRFGQELFGFTESEIVGKHVLGTIIPDGEGVDDFLRGMIDDLLTRPDKYGENENKNFRKDGSAVWMMWRNKPIVAEDGTLEGIISIGIDITERKKAEQALHDSETRIRTIVENAADGIVVIGEDGVVQSFSPAAERIFGYMSDEVMGKKVNMLMPEPMRTEHNNYLKRYFETGEKRVVGINREVIGLRKDGTEFPMELAVGEAVLKDESIFVGIIRDITLRKKAERALADQLAFNMALVDAIPNPMFVKTPDTKFVAFNKAYEEAFGIERDRYIGKTVLELDYVPQAGREAFQKEAETLLDEGGARHRELSIILADGHEHQMLYWTRTFDLSDGPRGGLLGVLVDITRQKELERQLSIANKRMGEELNIGREIQMSMIPLTFPRFPEHKDIDVWAHIRPAREVGGDFYDFFFINERLFAFVVADVSGKGVPAALLMAVAKTLLKAHAQETQSTTRIVELTNNELSQNNKDCMFITAFFGIIDTKTGAMTYTNAGHNPPYLLSPDGSVKSLVEIHGPMIGVMEGLTYDQTEIVLGVDDKLLLYTDGITEAFNPDGQAFGEERLSEMLGRSGRLGTKYLVDTLVHEVDEFTGNAEQSDDITVFCLRNVAWEGREDRARIDLHLANEMAEIERALTALREFCDRFDLPPDVRNDVGVILDDLLNNIISYAFEDQDEHVIEVSLATDKQRFIVTVSDDGVEFDPFLRPEPDIESDINDRQVGGLGIHLIRSLMDDCSYRRVDGRNVTTLMKRMGR
jgi:PAS domain S-box-containing protein